MVFVEGAGTFAWTIFGQAINKIYQKHYLFVNSTVSLLLIFSIVDLWN